MWQLPFTETTCKCLHIGRNNPGLSYAMNGHIMEGVSFQKEFGVIIDQDLKFHQQTAAAVKKVKQVFWAYKRRPNERNI